MAINNNVTRYIWNYFLGVLGNKYGVAALMGNLEAESGMYPDRVQGDIPYSSYSANYTAQVNSGVISRYDFVYNGPGGGGYGLAQWTYSVRKADLYDKWKSGGYSSIGATDLACDYLWWELCNRGEFSGVKNALLTATSIRAASDVVLHQFENPADQSASVEAYRASLGQAYYDLFKDGTGEPDPDPDPDEPEPDPDPDEPDPPEPEPVPLTRHKMSLLLMWAAMQRR